MSGGFFRGTTADQDTRFSNKQAKLLKTQKFHPELEHLVDVSKVKMDVIKPWIAKRVTEFLGGFEDEVLINFIYGLLEGKEINGKAVQIQLTGFMEKNTGKFMKELWALLLSAQNNASGVPQQFLDAKEEETRKKKLESDRITNEIQKRRDKEIEEDKRRKTDGGLDDGPAEESNRRRQRDPDSQSRDENVADVRNGFRGRNRSPRLPNPSDRSPSPHRGRRSRSISRSYSKSRSDSKERSISKSSSPGPRRHSVSPETIRGTPQRSVSPRKPAARGSISPKRGSHYRRSSSRSRRRSPSPIRSRIRSPLHRRSPSPFRRRSRSPVRRRSRSPVRRRSPPRRRRSPSPRRRRSPSPIRQRRRRSTSSPRSRSPAHRRRSPFPRRRRSTSSPRSLSPSPVRRRYQSPVRRRSPYAVHRRSPSLDRRRSPLHRRRRSPSPVRRRSPSPVHRRSPVRVRRRSPTRSLSGSQSSPSPVRETHKLQTDIRGSPRERTKLNDRAEPVMVPRRPSMAMSPQRDNSDSSRSRRKVPSISPSSPEKSPSYIDSPKPKTRSSDDKRRLASSYGSSHKRAEDQMTLDRSQSPPFETKAQRVRQSAPHNNKEEFKKPRDGERSDHKSIERGSDFSYGGKKKESLDESPSRLRDIVDLKRNATEMASLEVTPEEVKVVKQLPHGGSGSRKSQVTSYPVDASKSDEKRSSLLKDAGNDSKPDALLNQRKKQRSPSVSSDSGSEGSDKRKVEVTNKRKRRRSSRRESPSDDSSSDSEIEDRKEAKRRKREEKKLRKEERRRRRDERRQRKEEKRAGRRKRKDGDGLTSDLKESDATVKATNGGRVGGKYSSEEEETESQKKKLEIELREKALESLRAKKGIHR